MVKLAILVGTPLRDHPSDVAYTLEVTLGPDHVVDAVYSGFSPDHNKASTSVTLAHVIERDGVVQCSLSGTNVFSTAGLVGWELRGDPSCEIELLPDLNDNEHDCAVFSGTLVDQTTSDESNSFVDKTFTL